MSRFSDEQMSGYPVMKPHTVLREDSALREPKIYGEAKISRWEAVSKQATSWFVGEELEYLEPLPICLVPALETNKDQSCSKLLLSQFLGSMSRAEDSGVKREDTIHTIDPTANEDSM